MIASVLLQKNELLLRNVRSLQGIVRSSNIPAELETYRSEILKVSEELEILIDGNLLDIQAAVPQTVDDILSSTQQATQLVRLLSNQFLSPLVRPRPEDTVCLKVISWMHRSHRATARFPAAFVDGSCGVRPMIAFVPIYSFPHLEQRGFLFLPLLFHEFGHLLYRCHKRKMDNLAQDFQRQVGDLLFPRSLRNDRYTEEQFSRRQRVMDTWYYWTQEMYCDAVGFRMGNLAYLYAFSEHLGLIERGDFYRDLDDLEGSTHPVTWLRIKMLTHLTATAGFASDAVAVHDQWHTLAETLRIEEDYHGYFDERLIEPLDRTIAYMIEESSPIPFDSSKSRFEDSPPGFLHEAWNQYRSSPEQYDKWEAHQIRSMSESNLG